MKDTTHKAIVRVRNAVGGLIRRMETEYATLTDKQYGKVTEWGQCIQTKTALDKLLDSRLSHTIQEERIKKLREGLKFIAHQGCQLKGEYASCKDLPNNPCITEYCLPCYAAEILVTDDRDEEWCERRRGLEDNQP